MCRRRAKSVWQGAPLRVAHQEYVLDWTVGNGSQIGLGAPWVGIFLHAIFSHL